jgi:hypothetical protein
MEEFAMPSEHEPLEYNEREKRLFGLLPRESEPEPGQEDRLVDVLRGEGFFRAPRPLARWAMQVAAAITLLLMGGWAGGRIALRDSLEANLLRNDLTVSDRVLLLQRAGSLYVRAANAYAAATARTDSTAIEVASQVLIGAAQAVARSDLDGGLTPELTAVLRRAAQARAQTNRQPTLWF